MCTIKTMPSKTVCQFDEIVFPSITLGSFSSSAGLFSLEICTLWLFFFVKFIFMLFRRGTKWKKIQHTQPYDRKNNRRQWEIVNILRKQIFLFRFSALLFAILNLKVYVLPMDVCISVQMDEGWWRHIEHSVERDKNLCSNTTWAVLYYIICGNSQCVCLDCTINW